LEGGIVEKVKNLIRNKEYFFYFRLMLLSPIFLT
jgi:hypothetical protein